MKIIQIGLLSSILGIYGWALECSLPPITLSEQKATQWASRAAMNAKGAATVVWIKSIGQEIQILQAATRPNAESSWTPARAISDTMNIYMYFPVVTVDGTSTVIWSGLNQNKTLQHYFTKKEGDSHWTSTQMIDYPELTKIEDAAVDFRGDPLILASKPKEFGMYSYHYQSNEKPSQPFRELPKLPNPERIEAFVPQMFKNHQGQIGALWVNKTNVYFLGFYQKTDYQFLFAQYDDKNKWDASPTPIGLLNFNDFDKDKVKDISTSFNKKDEIAIIWSYFDSASLSYKLNSLVKSQLGTKFKELQGSDERFTDSAILMDDNGNTVAVWIKPIKKQSVVYAAFKPKESETWLKDPAQLSNISHKAEGIQLSFHNGVFVVVWGEADSTTFKRSIFGATLAPKPENFQWTPPVQLSPPNQNCWYPSIAFGEKGGIITWTTHVKRSTDYQIQVANLTVP